MIRMMQRALALGLVCSLVGCAAVKLESTTATAATVEKLRTAQLAPTQVGEFKLAPGKRAEMDTGLGGLRGSSLEPAKGTWSQQLKDTLITELTAAGLLDGKARHVIEGQLTDSQVDAAIGTGTGRLAARFLVKRDGSVVFDKELAAESRWESSFMGAIAVPAAMTQYGALYKALVAKLVDDPDFRRALAK